MVARVPARRGLEHLPATDLQPIAPQPLRQLGQPGTVRVVDHGLPVPLQLGGGHHVITEGGRQPVGAEPHVPAAVQGRVDLGLVRRLVGAEPYVPVGPGDPARTELAAQLVKQFRHGLAH